MTICIDHSCTCAAYMQQYLQRYLQRLQCTVVLLEAILIMLPPSTSDSTDV